MTVCFTSLPAARVYEFERSMIVKKIQSHVRRLSRGLRLGNQSFSGYKENQTTSGNMLDFLANNWKKDLVYTQKSIMQSVLLADDRTRVFKKLTVAELTKLQTESNVIGLICNKR